MKKLIALALVAFALIAPAANLDEDFGAWESINVKYKATDRLSLHMMEQVWMRDSLKSCDQWYLRFWFMYKVCDWLSLGPGYEFLEANTTPDKASCWTHKDGFFGQAVLSQKLWKFDFNVRERLVYSIVEKQKESDSPESYVSRTRFMVRFNPYKDCPVVPFAYDEIFVWDRLTQNRPAVGCTFKCTTWLSFDLSYIRQTRYKDGEGRNNNIISLDANFSF